MPRTCKICALPNRAEIDQQLLAGQRSYRSIATLCNVSQTSVLRHARNHIPATLAAAQEARDLADSDRLLDQVRSLNTEARQILENAKGSKDQRLALYAIDRLARLVEIQGKLMGELQENTTNVSVNVNGEAARIVAIVCANVTDSETRTRIAEALRELG